MVLSANSYRIGTVTAAMLIVGWLTGCTTTGDLEIGGSAKGEACHQISDCVAGLTCENDLCVEIADPNPGPQRGDPCTSPSDCAPDLFCGPQDVCSQTPGAQEGASCGLTVDCQKGLVCHGDMLVCVNPDDYLPSNKGVKDEGQSCSLITDCRRPYICSIAQGPNAKCDKLPYFPGPDCLRSEAEVGVFRVYYELPPDPIDTATFTEFYRLPFPNDIRVNEGRISLRGHPSPGEIMGIDVAGEYIQSVENKVDGFALNGPVFFRLTDFPKASSICLDASGIYPDASDEPFCQPSAPASVYLINIDPTSAQYNQRIPIQIALFKERGQYMCQNAIGLAPLDGQPLLPNTIYAAILTTALRDVRDHAPVQDLDFAMILDADESLSEHVLSATKPLRDWITVQAIDQSTIAAASVFTTGNPAQIGQSVYEAVLAEVTTEPAPCFNPDAFECSNSPAIIPACHGRLTSGQSIPSRSCGSSASFYEIHGTYQAPVYQSGTRPYLTSALGGELNQDASGVITKTGEETICYALAIPKAVEMPSEGWPVVIYAHGTGGNYRSFTEKSLTDEFISMGFAVIGIDNVMHGPRQDPSSDSDLWLADLWNLDDPGTLYFNVINPLAALGNTLQGAADLFYLTQLLANDYPNVADVNTAFNPDQIFFVGHSQGTTIVSPYLVHESQLKAAVLSGAGAELVLSILSKTKPVNISEFAATIFGDQNLSRIHPMMGILALLFGPADSVVYADQYIVNQHRAALPLLMFSGIGDNYTPGPTQEALIRSMGVPLVSPIEKAIPGVSQVAPPVSDSTIFGTQAGVPAGVVQIRPTNGTGSDDGHFVMFNYSEAADILKHFFQTTFAGSPEIDR